MDSNGFYKMDNNGFYITSFEKQTIMIKYFENQYGQRQDPITKIEKGDWIDLRSNEAVSLKAGDFKLIHLGVGMKLPEEFEAHIAPRSSTFKKWGILQTNSIGIIDNSYSGDEDEWMMPVYATRDTMIERGDRICQFRIVKRQPEIEFVTVDKLDETSRGGFGSTGTK